MPWENYVKQCFIDCEVPHLGRASEHCERLRVGYGHLERLLLYSTSVWGQGHLCLLNALIVCAFCHADKSL